MATQTITSTSTLSNSQNHFVTLDGIHSRKDSNETQNTNTQQSDIQSIPPEQSNALPPLNTSEQPQNWLQLRGVPAFLPINRNQDFSIRPLGANGGERFFLVFMLSGVMIQNWANVAWRGSLGRLNEKWFTFKLGGEW